MTTRRPPAQVTALARRTLDDLPAMTDRLVTAILADDPSYVGQGTSLEDLRASCHDNLGRILEHLAGEERDDEFDVPRATGHRRAEQGVPVEALLHAFRLGHRVIWDSLVAQARDEGTLDVLVEAAAHVWDIVESFTAAVASAYRDTETVLLQRDARRREALLDALIEGRGRERAVLKDAASALDLPETGRYAVLLLEGTDVGRAVQDAMSVRGLRTASRTRTDREVVLVALGTADLTAVAAIVDRVGDVRAGLSPQVDGLADVDLAHRLAETALRALPRHARGVTQLDDRLPAALVASAPDLAVRLVDRVLGPVLALGPHDRALLLATVSAWLETGGSAGQTAQRLFCHRNTVLNRIRRVESLTGRSMESVTDLVQWSLALTALDVVGDHTDVAPSATLVV